MPNPYTRLEAIQSVESRLAELADALRQHEQAPNVEALCFALGYLRADLHAALWGRLGVVDGVRRARDVDQFVRLIWPPADRDG